MFIALEPIETANCFKGNFNFRLRRVCSLLKSFHNFSADCGGFSF